jgi:hypothetical protein
VTLPGGDETDTEPEGTWIVIETVTNWIDKHTAFYRGYLPDDRSLIPLTIALTTSVALWFLIYLVSVVVPQPVPQMARPAVHPSSAADTSIC